MLPDVSSRQTRGEQRMHDLLQIEVVGSKSDWSVLGLDKYGIVWSGTPRPVGATFELDWVQVNENITKKEKFPSLLLTVIPLSSGSQALRSSRASASRSHPRLHRGSAPCLAARLWAHRRSQQVP